MANEYIFPPIVDTYQEAWVIGQEEYYIFFRLPAAQVIGKNFSYDISIRDQFTFDSVLKSKEDFLNVKMEQSQDTVIIKNDLVDLSVNTWYRIQLRLVDNNNQNKSEWSAVTLVKAISKPFFTLISPQGFKENESVDIDSQFLKIVGEVSFENPNDQESISSYEIEVFNQNKELIEKSGTLYPETFNSRQLGPYSCKTLFRNLNNKEYTLKITYLTRGFYKQSHYYNFNFTPLENKFLQGDFLITPINEKGYMEIQLGLSETDIQNNSYYQVLRSNSGDGYSTRETIFIIDLNSYIEYPRIKLKTNKSYVFSQVLSDITAEPGIAYRYYLTDKENAEYQIGPKRFLQLDDIDSTLKNNSIYIKEIVLFPETIYELSAYKRQIISNENDLQIKFFNKEGKEIKTGQGQTFEETKVDIIGFDQEQNNKVSLIGKVENFPIVSSNGEIHYLLPYTIKTKNEKIKMVISSSGKDEKYFKELNIILEMVKTDTNRKETFIEELLDIEFSFLTDSNATFRIINSQVTDYKYVVQESIINTLGSTYPFVRRNGNTKYRQFTLTGVICGYGDDDGLFFSPKNILPLISQPFYRDYKEMHKIVPWNDYLFEKQYREKAIDFLTNGTPKLYKSLTEGNIIGILTSISFTPNNQLSRNIYDFSATFTEIDQNSIENYQKYSLYKNNTSELYIPTEYYLIANEVVYNGNILTAYSDNKYYQPFYNYGYLCLTEVDQMLQAQDYNNSIGIPRRDSLRREFEL